MSNTNNEQNDSKGLPAVRQLPDNDNEEHINCGTPECCGECDTEDNKQ